MLVNLLSRNLSITASRSLATHAVPIPMPKCDFKPDKYQVIKTSKRVF